MTFVAADGSWVNNTWYSGGAGDPDLVITKPAGTLENHFMIAYGRQNTSANVTLPSGWTSIHAVAAAGNSYFFAYKVAGASEPPTYTFTTDTTTSSSDGGVSIATYSGFSTSTPFDVTFDSATHLVVNGSQSSHSPPDIATRAANSTVLTIILTQPSSGSVTFTQPTGYALDDGRSSGPGGPGGAIASKDLTAPTNEDPGPWTTGVNTPANVITLSMRDASAIYVEISGVTWEPPTGYSHVTYAGDVIPESSILHLHRGTHTGSNNVTALVDSAVTLTLDEWANYEFYNFTDNSSATISGNAAGTGPTVNMGAITGGTDNNIDTDDSYDIRVKMTSGDQIGYKTAQTSNSGSFSFEYYLVDSTDGGATSDFTATVSASGLPVKTGTVSLTTNGSPSFSVTGDAAGGSSMTAILGDNVLGDNVLGDILAAGDVTAPTLSSPTGTGTATTTASGTVSTNEDNGTLYWICDENGTAPSVAQIQAGQNQGGSAAADSGNQAVSAAGTQNVSATGLTAATTYYFHYQQQDTATNDSTVVTSASFATNSETTGTGGPIFEALTLEEEQEIERRRRRLMEQDVLGYGLESDREDISFDIDR